MQFCTRNFTYYTRERCFVAEMSTLDQGGRRSIWERVYPDACDIGITLVSHRTGEEVTYVLTETKHTADGNVAHWRLHPVKNSKREAIDTLVLIFND